MARKFKYLRDKKGKKTNIKLYWSSNLKRWVTVPGDLERPRERPSDSLTEGGKAMSYAPRYVSDNRGNISQLPPSVNWNRNLKAGTRRKRMKDAYFGDLMEAGRACNAIGSRSRDKATERAARADAKYFFKLHEKMQREQGRIMKFVD